LLFLHNKYTTNTNNFANHGIEMPFFPYINM